MRVILLILFFPLFVHGQQKEEILKAIVKINRLETADKGPFIPLDTNRLSTDEKKVLFEIPNKYDNYKNFQALRKLIDHDELLALTKHENGVVRLFAVRELIKERDYNFDFYNFFLTEFNKGDKIESQFADMIDREMTYKILLADLSGDWNYARSTGAKEDFKFLSFMSQRIDSFILFKDFDFYDEVYIDIFDRQKFGKSANGRILELIKIKFNFWAFDYLKEHEPKLYDSIKVETVIAFDKHKGTLLTEHPNFFQWFLRYLITSRQYEIAKSFLQELKKRDYSKETIDWMLMGIDEKLIEKVK